MKFVRHMEGKEGTKKNRERERIKQRNSLLYVGTTWYLHAAENHVVIAFIFWIYA
jgi:hypothetical protein